MKILIGHCIRCGSTPQLTLDMGKFGMVPLCTVCWTGLASCMEKDLSLWRKTENWMEEFNRGWQLRLAIEDQIEEQQKEAKNSRPQSRVDMALEDLDLIHKREY